MKLKLDESIASLQDLRGVIIEIRDYARWYSHNALKKQAGAKNHVDEGPELSVTSKTVLRDWAVSNPLNRTSLDALIKQLEMHSHDAPAMTITLAAPPTRDIKNKLTSWCRENISPDILVTYEFNQAILGGMVVRYGSRIHDWSFRRQILEQRAKFPEVLRGV